jgi:hypothetical protein
MVGARCAARDEVVCPEASAWPCAASAAERAAGPRDRVDVDARLRTRWVRQDDAAHRVAGRVAGHALAAGDFERAAGLVELAIPDMRRTRQEAAVRRWLQALPDELIRARPVLAVTFAATLLTTGLIFTGVVSLLSLVTLRQDLSGASAAALVGIGASHVAVYNWTFLLSQSLMPGINALLLGSLLFRSRLVPRFIPVLGLIGGPILIASVIAALLHADHQVTVLAAGFLPVAAWEFSLGGWLVLKGFRPSPITAALDAASGTLAERGAVV